MDIKDFLKNDRLASLLGIELLEAGNGRAKARLEIKEKHLNTINMVHGGTLFSLADFVFAAASNSHGNIAVAINASISFIKASYEGTLLTAEAHEVSCNKKLATYNITITDNEDSLVASFQGMVYRKRETF